MLNFNNLLLEWKPTTAYHSCFQSFVDKQVKFFLENKINEKSDTVNATNNLVKYYKLPDIGHILTGHVLNFIVKV